MANINLVQRYKGLTSRTQFTIVPDIGYELPEEVIVTNGTLISYNSETGVTVVSGDDTTVINAAATLKSFTLTFDGTYCSWGSNTKTAYYGDVLSVTNSLVTCYIGFTNVVRWTNTATANLQTDQWTYSTPTITGIVSPIVSAFTITGTSTRSERYYNVSFINASVGSWDSTTAISAPYSATISVSGNVVTVNGESRTYGSLPSTSNTTSYKYYVSNIGISNGTQVGTGQLITPTVSTANKTYGVSLSFAWQYQYNSAIQKGYYYARVYASVPSGFSQPTELKARAKYFSGTNSSINPSTGVYSLTFNDYTDVLGYGVLSSSMNSENMWLLVGDASANLIVDYPFLESAGQSFTLTYYSDSSTDFS